MNTIQVSIMATLALKKVEFTSLLKEITMNTDELISLESTYTIIFNDNMQMKFIEFNNMQMLAFFNLEKKKHFEKMSELKKTLAYLNERKELKILEYDGLICMYRIL